MGILYAVVPLTDDLHEWLAEQGVSYPSATGRYPTPNELRRAYVQRVLTAARHLGFPEWYVQRLSAFLPRNPS
jgi:hypothetical protein